MYENQTDGLAFHELLPAVPVGVRSRIEGIAQRALQRAGVECDVLNAPSNYSSIIGAEALQGIPVIMDAQTEMRKIYNAHFGLTEV